MSGGKAMCCLSIHVKVIVDVDTISALSIAQLLSSVHATRESFYDTSMFRG